MIQHDFQVEGIPAVLWGEKSDELFIAVHGDQSNKADDVIVLFAEEAIREGYQVLSFDLPEHGERVKEARPCKVQNCVEDLGKIMDYARTLTNDIGVFGCSVGAYFTMLAYKDETLRQSLFLSPVVDMKRLIENIMRCFNVSEERLEKEREISTPVKNLYWDYFQYVAAHPVVWDKPTSILYGSLDSLCEREILSDFAARSGAEVTVMEGGEHWFHTDGQLRFFKEWLAAKIGEQAKQRIRGYCDSLRPQGRSKRG